MKLQVQLEQQVQVQHLCVMISKKMNSEKAQEKQKEKAKRRACFGVRV